jgi:superfamily I DNA/RNA helicase
MTPTPQQRDAIKNRSGLFTVRACPGSGKTITVAARLQRLLRTWPQRNQGIAVASFTNIAWMEIRDYLAKDFRTPFPGYPHFLGTLDSFINNYIFLPFGHLVMGSRRRPELWGPPHNDDEPIGRFLFWKPALCNKNQCRLNDFTYDRSGSIVHVRYATRAANCPETAQPCIKYKKLLGTKGVATQSDASYWAAQVLRTYPLIAAALAHRFPVLMVDEAQDTSATQMDFMDLLIAAGLQEVMLVGDPDQAIYEWREAEPALFVAKCTSWAASSTALNENWRSSQHICGLASRLSSLQGGITAANTLVARYPSTPQLVPYSSDQELRRIVQDFAQRARDQGCDTATTYVITRGKNTLNEILPGTVPTAVVPWTDKAPNTAAILHAKYLYDNHDFAQALKLVARATCDDNTRMADSSERGGCFSFLQRLPSTDNATLGNWIEAATAVLHTCPEPFCDLQLAIKRKSKIDYGRLRLEDVFGRPRPDDLRPDFQLATVHAVKGRSLDAVLLVLKTKGGMGQAYRTLLRVNAPVAAHEELRLVYVAITRARKMLTIAVPNPDVSEWSAYLHLSPITGQRQQPATPLD